MGGNHHHHHHEHGHEHGHNPNSKSYDHLHKRLDANPVSIPNTPLIKKTLSILFSEVEAELVAKMPGELSNLASISKATGMSINKAEKLLEKMADGGMVFDLEHNGEKYYILLPAIPGFVEFSMASERNDFSQKEMAKTWKQVREKDHFALFTSLFGINKETQYGRVITYEDTIKKDADSEVCTYDRVSEVLEETSAVSVILCHCRHERRLNNEDTCSHPLEVCLAFGVAGELFARHDIGRSIDKAEAKEIIDQTEELGLVHFLDNVQKKPAFMCNCCSCACDMLRSFYEIEPFNTVMSSNFIAQIDNESCTGCGKCVRRCPIGAITLNKILDPLPRLLPAVDESICIGCGACGKACKKDALHLAPRENRIITPETAFHRMALMALERGKFQDFLFANPSKVSDKIAKVMIRSFINFPPMKKVLLQKQVNSKFLDFMFDKAKKSESGWVFDFL